MNLLGPLAAFALTVVLILALRPLAASIGLVDVPSSRKSHTGNIPLVGGISIYCAAMLLAVFADYISAPGFPAGSSTRALFASGLVLVVIGAWDDYRDLPPVIRFVAQIIASLTMIYSGGVVLIDLGDLNPAGGVLELGWVAVPFTVFACLGVINATNMCDGLDGLSGSLALIALLGLGLANALWGGPGDQYLIAIFAACLAGFLMFNLRTFWRSKASIFLGDAGSMLLGLVLAWLTVSLSQGEDRVMAPAAALWFLMLPLYDAVSMMLRRLLLRRSPFEADREHLHHIFLLAGFSVGETVTLMSGIALVGIMIGLGSIWFEVPDIWVAVGFLVGGLLHYWAVRRAWQLMRFLSRSICRRNRDDRRAANGLESVGTHHGAIYTGIERRFHQNRRVNG